MSDEESLENLLGKTPNPLKRDAEDRAWLNDDHQNGSYPSRLSDAFNVVRLIWKCSATSALVIIGSESIAAAFFTSEAVITGFRPPLRPRARAANANRTLHMLTNRLCQSSQ